MVIENSYQYCS